MHRRDFLLSSAFQLSTSRPGKNPPGARRGHTLVSIPARNELLLFGGLVDRDPSGLEPLWSYSSVGWRQRRANGPRSRSLAASAADPSSGALHIQGGLAGAFGTRFGDHWSWDGMRWNEIFTPGPGPGPRDHHSMSFDDSRGMLVLHGGSVVIEETQHYHNDTWLFKDNSWSKIDNSAMTHRAHHATVYDPVRKQILAFGGVTSKRDYSSETWAFNGNQWVLLTTAGPPPLGLPSTYKRSHSLWRKR